MRSLLLFLIPAVALAQGLPLKDGDSSTLLDLNAAGRPTVKLVDANATEVVFTEEGRVDIGQDQLLFADRFVGATVTAHSRWAQSSLIQAVDVTGGRVRLNSTAITTLNTYSHLKSVPVFRGYSEGPLFARFRAAPTNLPQTSVTAEIGFFNALTNAAPTDGAFIRWTSSGGVECVVNIGGSETSTSITAPVATGVYSIFEIRVTEKRVICSWVTPSTAATASATVTLSASAATAFVEATSLAMRIINGAPAPSLAPQLFVGFAEAYASVPDLDRHIGHMAASEGGSIAFSPVSGAQATNHTNSANPASAALSNTAASYATLGGRYQFAAVGGAATDYALFGFQVPTSYRLVVTGIRISTCNTVATVATTPTIIDWSAGVQSTAVSLATADAIAASPTSAPRRVTLGQQGFVVGDLPGRCAQEINADFGSAPLVVDSGRFFHVIMQVHTGTATATEIFRGDVSVAGYFIQG